MNEIEIENELKHMFVGTMIRLANNQSRSMKSEHLKEFEEIKIKAEDIHLNDEIIKLELSDYFYNTWIWRTFSELFNPHGRYLDKNLAKKLNRLHESTIGDYNEDFLKNYNSYYD